MPISAPSFLTRHLPIHDAQLGKPYITLTWAQSLDAKIAGPGGTRVILSGPESMEMTHWMRTMHDAIMVGINTILLDDPRLRIQLVPQDDPKLLPPQPLILDPQLKFSLSARLLLDWNEWNNSRKSDSNHLVRQPWLICGVDADRNRQKDLEEAGARIIPVSLDTQGRVPANSLPGLLTMLGLRSVMIEGGSRVISSFLRAPLRDDGTSLVNSVVITVAPTFIGEGVGMVPQEEADDLPTLIPSLTETMGKDVVTICSIEPRSENKRTPSR